MRGQVLDFSIQEGKGIISGEDGRRYEFEAKEWKEKEIPQRGDLVDFDVAEDGRHALAVYRQLDQPQQQGKKGRGVRGEKSKIVAALLAFFFGALGFHKFYIGCNREGAIMLVAWFIGLFLYGIPILVNMIIALIEGIIYLTKSDEEFHQTYVENEKCWF
ncbi:MAG: TM2 domain-containing protein [Epsilonproteobacteria bacterium]|nr:hypothetical protein [Campylobacterota bacterium]NPA57279.1 TM2 domain-containing protein [Campylobacterota bacterium]